MGASFRRCIRLVLAAITLFVACQVIFAQTVTLEGSVSDRDTGEPLVGANIIIDGTSHGEVTDVRGWFKIDNVETGTITLIVSYIGYQSDSISLLLLADELNTVDIRLSSESQTLDQVVVTAVGEGQMRAMLDQKAAINIKNIISSELIESFPDLNAAESINRIPGITLQRDQGEGRFVQVRGTPPELSNFSINGEQIPSPEGNVRYVGLDIIPSDQLESIEVTKALTPDMDADGIGGNVNLITKTAKQEEPEFHAVLAGEYNHLSRDFGGRLQASFGQRFGKFGVYVNGSYNQSNRMSHNMEFRFNQSRFAGDTTFRIHYDDVQHRHYTISRTRLSGSVTFDYQFNTKNSIFVRGVFNEFKDDEQRRRARYNIGDGFLTSATSSREASVERDTRDRTKVQTLNSLNLGGGHNLDWLQVNYLFSYSEANESVPDRRDITFKNSLININLDLSDPEWPVVYFPRGKDSVSVWNYSDYEMDELLFVDEQTTDINYTAKLDLQVPFPNGYFKFGGKTRLKDKERDKVGQIYDVYYNLFAINSPFDSSRQIYTIVGPDLTLETLAGDFDEYNLMNHGYHLGLTPDPEKTDKFIEFYRQNFKLNENDTKEESHSEDYSAEEDIFAAYAMAEYNINKFTIIGGLRFERTDIRYTGYDVQFREFSDAFERIDTLHSSRRYDFILPQLHLKYSLDENTNLRLAATFSYSRPNFEDILPYRQIEYDSREVTQGNPDLNFARSLNLDLLFEKYYMRNGLVSGGLFYKNIRDFVYYFEQRIFLDDVSRPGWYFVTSAQNGENADLFGLEVSVNQYLWFLRGWGQNFGVYVNYTYTYSDAYINLRTGEPERISLPGQAPHVGNFAFFYDSPRLYCKLAASFQDDFLDELGIEKEWDIYYEKNLYLDFNAHYNFSSTFQVFGNATNLTNAPLKYYQGDPSRVRQKEFYSWSLRAGLRINL